MHKTKPSLLMPALIGGGAFGFVAALPLIGALNCACCALIVGGGVLAAFLQSRACAAAGTEFTAGDGAMVGLIAAAPYAVVTTIVSGLISLVMPSPDADQMVEMLEGLGLDLPPEAMEQIGQFSGGGGIAFLVIGLFFSLFMGAIFSTIGGVIGGAAFKVEPKPPLSGTTIDTKPVGGDPLP